jgi:hypothetical protein
MSLTNIEYAFLLGLEKEFEDRTNIVLGPAPLRWERALVAPSTKDLFQLNFYRGSIEILKYTYNNTYRKSIVLARYDSMGRHTNPDGTQFSGPHVHIYDEKFGDKIAHPISILGLIPSSAIDECLLNFLKYFNVKDIPSVQSSLAV